MAEIKIGDRFIGEGHPCYVVAEIGINHNGSLETALKLIDVAKSAGCDAVKLQKRDPESCVPPEQRDVMRDTPWGRISYLEYKKRIELDVNQLAEIAVHCDIIGIHWFASCWDEQSLWELVELRPVAFKVASASLSDTYLLAETWSAAGKCNVPVIASTGMSTPEQVQKAVQTLRAPHYGHVPGSGSNPIALLQATSAYPCDDTAINLRAMHTLRERYQCPVGYSGHERGMQPTLAAVAMGANIVERHITLDRTMWGTDQAASLEPHALHRLVRDIRVIERAMGDGVKRVMDCERPAMAKLRGAS